MQTTTTQPTFNRRIFTLATFARQTKQVLQTIPRLKAASRRKAVSRAFTEKIMLAVTQVNGCPYCAYGHALLALKSGLSPAEVRDLLSANFADLPEGESVALAFAQHYAETEGQPDPATLQRLTSYYGPAISADIISYIQMIMFGNLAGNTFDAFLSRLKGVPAANSRWWEELILFIIIAPAIVPLMPLMRNWETKLGLTESIFNF